MQYSQESEAAFCDFDASLLNSWNLTGSSLAGNSSLMFDAMSSDLPDEVALGELESLINVPVSTDYCPLPVAPLQYDNLQSSARCGQPQFATWAGSAHAGPAQQSVRNTGQMSHHVFTNSLTASNVSMEETVEVQRAGSNDLSGKLLKMLIQQQIQQNEQQQILENLQKAILRSDSDRIVSPVASSCALAPAPVSHKVSPSCSTNGNSSTSTLGQMSQPRSEQIRALLEGSPPAPNGAVAMQQYAHLSQNELRKVLLSTDCQQQMKRGANKSGNVRLQQTVKLANGQCLQQVAPLGAPFRSDSFSVASVAQPVKSEPKVADKQRFSASAFASAIDAESDYGDGEDDAFSPTASIMEAATMKGIAGGTAFFDPAGSSWCVAKKSTHNVIEKRYRSSINERIDELRHLVAPSQPMLQKSGVLRKTVDCLHYLRSQNAALRNENASLRSALFGGHAGAEVHVEPDVELLIPADSPVALDCMADASAMLLSPDTSLGAPASSPSNGRLPAPGRTQMLLCVAMLTLVVANPEMLPFGQSSPNPAQTHIHRDFATPHVGSRLLNAIAFDTNIQSDRTGIGIFTVLLLATVGLFFIALYCTLRKTSKLPPTTTSDRFAQLKLQADRQFAARQFDQANKTYAMALEVVDCLPHPNALYFVFDLTIILWLTLLRFVGLPRRTRVAPVPFGHLCLVYSRLLHAKPDVYRILAAFRIVLRFDSAAVRSEHLTDTYLSFAYAFLRCCKARRAAGRFVLRQVATLAMFNARCSTSNSFLLDARFFQFLSFSAADTGCNVHQTVSIPCSLSETLTIAYLRSLLNQCFAALRNGDAAVTRCQLDELARIGAQCSTLEKHTEFWFRATKFFLEFHQWQEQSSLKQPLMDSLRQQSALTDALDQLGQLLVQFGTADWHGVAVTSPHAVSIVYLVYRAVRSLALLDATGLPRTASLERLHTKINALSSSLQAFRSEAAADAFDLGIAWCAARWLLTLRMLLYELHRCNDRDGPYCTIAKNVYAASMNRSVTRKGSFRKWIGEYQRDLDTLSILKECCRESQHEYPLSHSMIARDEREKALLEAHLHQLGNSNPLGDVFMRLRMFGTN